MRILEVRDGFIKVESDKKQSISSFLEIKDSDNKFIAQIVKVSKFDLKYIFIAKLLFLYDGSFNALRGQNPKKESQITPFSFDLIQESFKTENPMTIGYLNSTETSILVDKSNLDRKMLVSFDSVNLINRFITNLAKEIVVDEQVLVIDMLGVMDSSAKIKASVDFKLPLNTETLQFMYEDCLNDATSDSKSLIKEIFADLAEYAKSVSFVPFKVLKTIVDDMVDKSHIFKLLVLKNKLAKFDKEGYFAVTQNELDSIKKITKSKSAVLDLSALSPQFQNRYLTSIYNELIRQDYSGQVFLLASNAIGKKNIKSVLQSKIKSVFLANSRFKYLNEFKSLFTNYLIESTFNNKGIFKAYSMLLENMPREAILFVGEGSNFIPVVAEVPNVDSSLFDDVIELDSDVSESEQVLSDAILYEVELPNDSQTVAIEKKSEDLIEKLAEEIKQEIPKNLFGNVEEDSILSEEDLDDEAEFIEDVEEISKSFKDENEFHTVVDTVTIDNLEEQVDKATEAIIEAKVVQVLDDDVQASDAVIETQEDVVTTSICEDNEDLVDVDEIIEDVELISEEIEYPSELFEIAESEVIIEEDSMGQLAIEEQVENSIVEGIQEDSEIIEPVVEVEQLDSEFDSIVDLEEDEYDSDGDIVAVDITDPEEEALNKEIIEDVDKVFTTMKDESLSESDLDFIDELNEDAIEEELEVIDSISAEIDILEDDEVKSDFEEITEYTEDDLEEGFIEPLEEFSGVGEDDLQESRDVLETKPSVTPMVPVYEAEIPQEDMVLSDPIEQGDTVSHAKYGVGVVEKMIKYGSKTLFSINFDNVGRRLLDPTLTEIKKA